MFCTNCGSQFPDNSAVCPRCAPANVPPEISFCIYCGSQVQGGDKLCGNCGQAHLPLGRTQISPIPPPPQGTDSTNLFKERQLPEDSAQYPRSILEPIQSSLSLAGYATERPRLRHWRRLFWALSCIFLATSVMAGPFVSHSVDLFLHDIICPNKLGFHDHLPQDMIAGAVNERLAVWNQSLFFIRFPSRSVEVGQSSVATQLQQTEETDDQFFERSRMESIRLAPPGTLIKSVEQMKKESTPEYRRRWEAMRRQENQENSDGEQQWRQRVDYEFRVRQELQQIQPQIPSYVPPPVVAHSRQISSPAPRYYQTPPTVRQYPMPNSPGWVGYGGSVGSRHHTPPTVRQYYLPPRPLHTPPTVRHPPY